MLSRKKEIFRTPPNQTAKQSTKIFETPGSSSNKSSFFNLDRSSNINNNNLTTSQNRSDESLSQADFLTPIEKLRLWRHDVIGQHQYKTAEFLGDKILDLTNDPNDAFWLAQVYFDQGNYSRCKDLILSSEEFSNSILCRYLAGYSLIKLEQWDEALELIGEENPFDKEDRLKNDDGGVKLEASMCYLRGLVFVAQNNFERAKECYKEALLVDVKCFEAFNELIRNNMMTPREEWEFVTSQLNYREIDGNNDLIKLLYATRLNKYVHVDRFKEAEQILREEYDLMDNCDLLLSQADYLYVQCNFDACLGVCEKILFKDQFNFDVLPNYLSCLYELGGRNKLFYKSHQLAELYSSNPMTWLAVGTYYLSINKIHEARKYFNKATMLNPNFGQAWIGFAHTFAAEGEHEQAISAYAYAAKLFPGAHLPNLFLGMQHLQMNNLNLAKEYLLASHHICEEDPLLLNELGVVYFHKNELDRAEFYLQRALQTSRYLNSNSKTWISIHANLGHVYRKSNEPYKALECFNQVLKVSNKNDANILSAVGLIHMKLGDYVPAIDRLHDALAISPLDPIANDLLKKALEANKENSLEFFSKFENLTSDLSDAQCIFSDSDD
ncbi:uncharacterized protein LODBEIA_P52810 [Lodderomyces beijingensis]|uniref:Uncharacterized protein n=1 Tax=Lodderomyces beijingensis TaxID=1775926 RepID=A0ABP0ZW49_9ASCO